VSARLRVTVSDGRGRPVRAPGLARWLERTAPAAARGDVSVALVGDRLVRRLNCVYRGTDRVTDVLSFPSGSAGPTRGRQHIGDIVIARPVAARQARSAGHSLATELRVLALHGLLHLLGYDHERDGGRMARLERRLRREGGLNEGLIERHVGRRTRPTTRLPSAAGRRS
jgi:probable rRNA maturation factor